jgi:pyruvyl transferase EpsO
MAKLPFLDSLGIPIIYECTVGDAYPCDVEYVKKILNPKTGLVCFSGGGSFGDIWSHLREAREGWLAKLHDYRVLQFPQTVHYNSMDVAKRSAEIWAAHPRATITVRDLASVAFLKKNFPKTPVIFVPDAAFMLGPQKRKSPKYDIFWLMRSDKESSSQTSYSDMVNYIEGIAPTHITVKVDDWLEVDAPDLPQAGGERFLTRRALKRTQDAYKILSQGKVVVSDRLHTHIITTLLDIPHVLVDNNNGKVFNVHKAWTKDAVHIQLATTLDDAMAKAIKLLNEYNIRESKKYQIEA